MIRLVPNSESLREVNHCHGKGQGHPCPKGAGDFGDFKTMPSEIEGVPIQKKRLESTRMLAIGSANGIALNTARKAQAIWKDIAGYQQRAFDSGYLSSAHPNHTLWHELAHAKSKRDNSIDHDSYLSNINGNSNPTFARIAKKVSRYAGVNGQEFVAEVFAGLRAGREFDDEVLNFYKHLKGPV